MPFPHSAPLYMLYNASDFPEHHGEPHQDEDGGGFEFAALAKNFDDNDCAARMRQRRVGLRRRAVPWRRADPSEAAPAPAASRRVVGRHVAHHAARQGAVVEPASRRTVRHY